MKYSLAFSLFLATASGLKVQSPFDTEQVIPEGLVSPPIGGWNVVEPFNGDVPGCTADATVMAADALTPQKTYNGGYAEATEIRLRIGNGAAGQSGLIGALADGFIQWMVKADVGFKPFKVGSSSPSRVYAYIEPGRLGFERHNSKLGLSGARIG